MLLASDFGDAPDTDLGTGVGDYNTLATDNGPSHTVVAGLKMGGSVDMDDGTLQNATANADDVNQALPDDEDGLNNPAVDLLLTQGTEPTVNVIVTNTTGSAATLSGWFDYNNDGVFDNATERAQTAVADGISGGVVTLTFPVVPDSYYGTTYARFRLSTDSAADDPTGAASDGEVEDHVAKITVPGKGQAGTASRIADGVNGGPTLGDNGFFGNSVASIGDLDGDGVTDMAVGAYADNTGGAYRGAVYVLLMNTDGSVKSSVKIAHEANGGPTLADGDNFGKSVTSLGDLDGDGVNDMAVGASADGTGGYYRGAVHVLFMNNDGTVKGSQKIAHELNGGPTLADFNSLGSSLATLGDLDGDGVQDLAAGAYGDFTGGYFRGAVHVLFMNTDGTAKSSQKIAHELNGGPTLSDFDFFGFAASAAGDLDGDGVPDLAVGADGDDTGGYYRGAVHVLLMNADGTVKLSQKIAHEFGGGPSLSDFDHFGFSAASLGDLDGDGVPDLAVGAYGDSTGGNYRGAVHVMLMNTDGTVKSSQKIAHEINGGPTLADDDFFGNSVTSLGDLNGDGVIDLAVGAPGTDTGGTDRGAVHVLTLGPRDNPRLLETLVNGVDNENRSGLTSLTLRFSQAVTVNDVTSLRIMNHTTGSAVDISAATLTGNGTTEVSWDFTGISFPDGNYTAELASPEAVNILAAPLAVTGVHRFHVLAGDGSGNAQVDLADFIQLNNNFNIIGGPILGPGDFDADGNVDLNDFLLLNNNFNNVLFTPDMDYGDAPETASFPTTLANDGARHILGSGLTLGVIVDAEGDGQADATAEGDDNAGDDDEDGVTLPALQAGTNADITVAVEIPTGLGGILNAWIDFNADGDWDDDGEQVFVDLELTNGGNALTVAIPTDATTGSTFARFRVTNSPGYSYTGLAPDGEVEDYQVSIVAAKSSSLSRSASAATFSVWAAAFADDLSSPTPKVGTQDPQGDGGGGGFEAVDMQVVDLAMTEVFSSKSNSPRAARRLSWLEAHLVDQLLEDDAELLVHSDGGGRSLGDW
jgi:hypothetical protein